MKPASKKTAVAHLALGLPRRGGAVAKRAAAKYPFGRN